MDPDTITKCRAESARYVLYFGEKVVGNIEGNLQAAGMKLGIVVSRFNSLITKQLLDGAQHAFRQFGGAEKDLTIVFVPGSFELPVVAKEMAVSGNFDSIVTLGAVIRGDTDHYDYVAGQAASGIAQAALETGVPIIFGVLTTNTVEQALQRSGVKGGNKGFEAVSSAIEMASVLTQLRGVKPGLQKRSNVSAV